MKKINIDKEKISATFKQVSSKNVTLAKSKCGGWKTKTIEYKTKSIELVKEKGSKFHTEGTTFVNGKMNAVTEVVKTKYESMDFTFVEKLNFNLHQFRNR